MLRILYFGLCVCVCACVPVCACVCVCSLSWSVSELDLKGTSKRSSAANRKLLNNKLYYIPHNALWPVTKQEEAVPFFECYLL